MKAVDLTQPEQTLDTVDAGQSAVVSDIRGGWNVRQRLNQMGIHVDDVLEVRRCCSMGGPILIRVHGTEVALGRGLAGKIVVTSFG